MTTCTGTGANGDHCCYIEGKVCTFLNKSTNRCTIWNAIGSPMWKQSKVGQWFSRTYPGYTCKDWPQNIPEVMNHAPNAGPFYTCCWGRGNS